MPRKTGNRIVRAVTDQLWKRDRLQMRVMDAVLSAVERKEGRVRRPPSAKGRKRAKSLVR